MTKKSKKKPLIITFSIIMVLAIIIGAFNIYFNVIGKQTQKGVAEGYSWNSTDTFTTSNITSLDMQKDDFKILALTDIHLKNWATFGAWFGVNYVLDWASEIALNKLVKNANPDLIIITGDSVLTPRNDIEYARLVKIMDKYEKPWAIVFGNHDYEGRADKAKLCDELLKSKYGLFQYGPADMHGAGNYVINLTRGNDINYSLYLMDSGECKVDDGKGGLKEESINEKQIEWYKWNVNGINNLAGKQVPNMAFFHIPLPQYKALDSDFIVGDRLEDSYPQYIDYGFFEAFSKNNGTHVFVGHDHNNNFMSDYNGVKLAYVQKSSYNCYFKRGVTGGTLITIKADNTVSVELANF